MNLCLLSFQRVIGTLDTLRTQYQWLRGVLRDGRSPQVFCHNDLHCGNLICNEDSGVVGVAIKVVGVAIKVVGVAIKVVGVTSMFCPTQWVCKGLWP